MFCFTLFALDAEAVEAIGRKESAYRFSSHRGAARIESAAEPDLAVAYDLSWIEKRLEVAGIATETVKRGAWRGKPSDNYQDIVVARKIA